MIAESIHLGVKVLAIAHNEAHKKVILDKVAKKIFANISENVQMLPANFADRVENLKPLRLIKYEKQNRTEPKSPEGKKRSASEEPAGSPDKKRTGEAEPDGGNGTADLSKLLIAWG